MLEKITKLEEKEIFINLYNTFLKPYFDNFLNEEEKQDLSFELDLESLENKNLYFYKENWEIIWFVSLKNKTENIVYISGFYILPKFQRKWFWTKMMEEILKILKEKNIKIVYLETYYKYKSAINFYQKNNFIYLKPEELSKSPLKDLYSSLVEKSFMFYKEI